MASPRCVICSSVRSDATSTSSSLPCLAGLGTVRRGVPQPRAPDAASGSIPSWAHRLRYRNLAADRTSRVEPASSRHRRGCGCASRSRIGSTANPGRANQAMIGHFVETDRIGFPKSMNRSTGSPTAWHRQSSGSSESHSLYEIDRFAGTLFSRAWRSVSATCPPSVKAFATRRTRAASSAETETSTRLYPRWDCRRRNSRRFSFMKYFPYHLQVQDCSDETVA